MVACPRYALAQLVVVCQMIDQRQKSADFFECFAANGQRGAEAVVQTALNPLGEQHASLEICGDAEGLKARRKGSVGTATIEHCHPALLVRKKP